MNGEEATENPLRILHLEDSHRDAEIIRERLIAAGFQVKINWASNETEFIAFLQTGEHDLILADYQLHGFDAPAALRLTRSLLPEIPFIAVTGAVGEEKAVELLKQGATDYVLKDRLGRLPMSIERALDEANARKSRALAEALLYRLNRQLRAISSCNQVLIRAESEQTLLQNICRIICDEAGYQMAWVGYAQNDTDRTVQPIVSMGMENGYLEDANITWSDTERGRGPTGTCIRNGETVYVQDFSTDQTVLPWRASAQLRGFCSSIALPLKDAKDKPFGALTIYSAETNAFNPVEILLLEELAADLAFGIGTVRTAAERTQMEKKVNSQAQEYRTLVENLPVLVDRYDKDLRQIFVSSSWEKIGELAEVLRDLDSPTNLEYRRKLQTVLDTGTPQQLELSRVNVHGATLYSSHTMVPEFNQQGNVVGVLAVGHDITETRRMEEERAKLQAQLQQSQKIESLGRLAGGIAHDMNNVLGAILGMASAHANKHPTDSSTYRAFDTISRAAVRGGDMVKRLLSFARQDPIEKHSLNVNTLLQEVVALLERTTLAKVNLQLDLASDLWNIRGDPNSLTNAIMNLCVNAMDAMPNSGRLTLRTRNWEEQVEIQVEDTGEGMPQEVLEKAFEPFFTTKPVGQGTGLGLSMVYVVVKEHQGQVEIQSEPGLGTLVKLRFPADAPEPPALHSYLDPESELPHVSVRVLLVDDDELIQETVQEILKFLGHSFTAVSNGEAAIALLRQGFHPDAVILDMTMPGLGGQGTLSRLRDISPSLPVLLATGRPDQSALDLVAKYSRVTLLSKPFTMEELKKKLEQIGCAH